VESVSEEEILEILDGSVKILMGEVKITKEITE